MPKELQRRLRALRLQRGKLIAEERRIGNMRPSNTGQKQLMLERHQLIMDEMERLQNQINRLDQQLFVRQMLEAGETYETIATHTGKDEEEIKRMARGA